ncbi:MAG: hypothetical protein A2252_11785 [Elusimicrobia bacterium RIFOXYA2_FULL_39_19]|nr:MAG: hypothetical protein A2252_11785 [Elusimicrobia bacterium RIFOXYA2_FULL_39_19]
MFFLLSKFQVKKSLKTAIQTSPFLYYRESNKSLLIFLTITLMFGLNALSYAIGAGSSVDTILSHGMGARPMGMGDAYTAVSDDVNGVLWNPAALSTIKTPELGTMLNQGLIDSKDYFFGYVKPSKRSNNAYGVSVTMLDGGNFEFNSPLRISKTLKAQSDTAVSWSYSTKYKSFKDWTLRYGLSFKFLSTTLVEQYSSHCYAFDLGLLMQNKKNISFGMLFQNLGTPVQYLYRAEPIPKNIRLGVSYKGGDYFNSYVTSVEAVNPIVEGSVKIHMGVEYWYAKLIAVRFGYKTGYDLDSMAYGIGFNVKGYQFDYANNAMGELGNTSKISLTMRFK